jgi:hypothetical protein
MIYYYVINSHFNRIWYADLIGQMLDYAPAYAQVWVLKEL